MVREMSKGVAEAFHAGASDGGRRRVAGQGHRRALRVLFLLASLCIAGVLQAQPSLAVLDALLDEGVDAAARVPVTEKVIEALVASGAYTVLDRSNVQEVLEEKKFQLSGLVDDSQIKQAGVYLGADFVGVIKVSIVGQTYFVSGKIIDVETGAITAQNSEERKGEIDIVLALAKNIGTALAGGAVEPIPEEVIEESREQSKTTSETEPIPQAEPKAESASPVPHVVVSYHIPGFIGSGNDIIHEQISAYIQDYGGTGDEYEVQNFGLSVHLLQPLFGIFYGSVSAGYFQRSDRSDYFYSFAADIDSFQGNFLLAEIGAAAGIVHRIVPPIQAYVGFGGSMVLMSLIDEIWGEPLTESALGLYVEAGADLTLLDLITVNAQFTLTYARLDDFVIFTNEENIGFVSVSVGGGFSY